MKSLQPTLKEKKRYIAFEIIPIKNYNQRRTLQKIISKLNELMGLKNAANAGIMPVTYKKQKGIIRVSNKFINDVKALLAFIKTIGTDEVIIKTLKTSGTLTKVKKYI